MQLKDKIALVTGAAQGIGEYVAREFAAEGAVVVVSDIDAPRLARTAAAIAEAGGEVQAVELDVRDREMVRRVAGEVASRFGRIDILVNNAGAYPRRNFLEMTDEEWDGIVDLNLTGTYNCSRAVAPLMAARREGAIVNISSVTFFCGLANLTHYISAKGGVVGFTRSLARDLGPHNVRVNCISPGAVMTESESAIYTPEQIAANILPLQSLQRRILPQDIARVAVFLASDNSSAMTGQTVNVDGGWVMY